MLICFVNPIFDDQHAVNVADVAYRLGVPKLAVLRWLVRGNPLHWVIA